MSSINSIRVNQNQKRVESFMAKTPKEVAMGSVLRRQMLEAWGLIVAEVATATVEMLENAKLSVESLSTVIEKSLESGEWRDMTSKAVLNKMTLGYVQAGSDNEFNMLTLTGNIGAVVATNAGAAAKLSFDSVRKDMLAGSKVTQLTKKSFRGAVIPTVRMSVSKIVNVIQGMVIRFGVTEEAVLAAVSAAEKDLTNGIIDTFWKLVKQLKEDAVDDSEGTDN